MSDHGKSPLSGLPFRQAMTHTENDIPYYVGEPFGPWASTLDFDPDPQNQFRPLNPSAPFQLADLDLTKAQLEQLKALALGHASQANLRGRKFPLFVTAQELKELQDGTKSTPFNFQPVAIEDLWREAQRLTLSEKAHETLRNLADKEPHPGFNHRLALKLDSFQSEAPEPNPDAPEGSGATSLIGLAFGAVTGERTLLFQSLFDDGLITFGAPIDYMGGEPPMIQRRGGHLVKITPKGYAIVEKLRKGDPFLTRKAFLVCRFIPEIHSLYANVYKPVGDSIEVQCPILRVMDIHHVDKIDDRIVHEIQEATVIVVDLTDTRKHGFNVAFEAGYALALGKPIVWTIKAPFPKKIPFDIQSHNILVYDPNKLDEFSEQLKYRLLAALEKAKA